MQTQTRSAEQRQTNKVLIGGAARSVAPLSILTRPVPAPVQMPTPGAEAPLSAAQQQMVTEHMPIVRYIARQLAERLPQHVEMDELIGSGMLGLVDAARKFNAGKGVQFRSYAQFRVRGAILDSLRSLDWSPRELRRKGRALEQTSSLLQSRLGRQPQDAEVAAEMGLSLAHFQELQSQLRNLEIETLNTERSESSGEEELAFLPAKESENPLFQCLTAEARGCLISTIDALPERERTVVRLYYFEEMNMREIGAVMGVVESRISQIHTGALRMLRGPLAALRAADRAPLRRAC